MKEHPERPTILIADDDPFVSDVLAAFLRTAGYEPLIATNGREALAMFDLHQPALVMLDLVMPEMDGWEVCRQLRARSKVPVIMLTGRSSESEKVAGLELGADDYVTKPFTEPEVVARVRALLRRAGYESEPLVRGPLWLDPITRTVAVNGNPVSLTTREFALLEIMMRHPWRVFSRADLLDQCWEPGYSGVDRVVDVHMSSLRRKIGRSFIGTVRGVGYRLEVTISGLRLSA